MILIFHKPKEMAQKHGHKGSPGACVTHFYGISKLTSPPKLSAGCRAVVLAQSSLVLVRHPYLRALRGSSVSTVFSSGWKRKSSTYSPNLS